MLRATFFLHRATVVCGASSRGLGGFPDRCEGRWVSYQTKTQKKPPPPPKNKKKEPQQPQEQQQEEQEQEIETPTPLRLLSPQQQLEKQGVARDDLRGSLEGWVDGYSHALKKSEESKRMLEAWGYVFTQNDEDDFFLITKSPFTNPKSEPTPTPTTPESTKAYKIEISCPLVIEKKTEGEGAGGMQEAAMGEGEGQEGEEGEGGMKVTEDMLKNFEQIEGGFIGGEGVEGGAQNQPTEEEMEKFWQQSQEQMMEEEYTHMQNLQEDKGSLPTFEWHPLLFRVVPLSSSSTVPSSYLLGKAFIDGGSGGILLDSITTVTPSPSSPLPPLTPSYPLPPTHSWMQVHDLPVVPRHNLYEFCGELGLSDSFGSGLLSFLPMYQFAMHHKNLKGLYDFLEK